MKSGVILFTHQFFIFDRQGTQTSHTKTIVLDYGGSTSAGHKSHSPETNLGETMPQTTGDEFKTKRHLPHCGNGCT